MGRARLRCEAGKTLQVRLKPAKAVRRALKATRPASLRITMALALRDGATLTRTLTLKR